MTGNLVSHLKSPYMHMRTNKQAWQAGQFRHNNNYLLRAKVVKFKISGNFPEILAKAWKL